MEPARLRPALVLSFWTLLVWTTRIRNIWTDDALSSSERVGRTVLALVFTAFAVATITAWLRSRASGVAPGWARAVVVAFAVWTAGVWMVRGAQIASGDHSVGFVVVHLVLAVVSIADAVWAYSAVRERAAPGAAMVQGRRA